MKAIISTEHSSHKDYKNYREMDVELQGGSPYFAYIWINDVLHVLRKHNRGNGFTITKSRWAAKTGSVEE